MYIFNYVYRSLYHVYGGIKVKVSNKFGNNYIELNTSNFSYDFLNQNAKSLFFTSTLVLMTTMCSTPYTPIFCNRKHKRLPRSRSESSRQD